MQIEHFTMAESVVRYLKSISDLDLSYKQFGKIRNFYSDADWGGDATNRKSYTGLAFILADCTVSWESEHGF